MKCLKIVILTLFLFKTFICESNFNKNIINGTAEDIIDYYMIEMQSKLFGFLRVILENNDTNNDSSEMDDLYDLIEGIDYNCFCFLIDIIEGRKFIYKIMKKLVHDGGIIQDSIGIEENCLDENGVYILFTGKNNITQLREDKGYMSKEDLFREALDFREEVCLFEECKFFYLPLFYYLSTFHKEAINNIFAFTNFTISGYIYNVNNTKEDVFNNTKDKEEIEREQEEDKYRHIVITIIQVLICIFALISIISWFIRKNNREIENKIPKSSEENDLLKNNSKKKENVDEEVENIFLSKEKMWEDLVWYKILSSFDFIKNLSLLNKKKEPLSDQTSLIVLSTIKILILFFILIGENAYLILKYVDNKMTSYYLIREISFINIKLGMNSYETYKVICGVIFGFKFINYYNKQGDFNFKKFFRFWTKPFPYIIIFLIIYFLFIYPSFIYARQLSPNYKNKYMSEIICSYSCQKHYYEIFNIFSIIEKYNSTDFYIGQYNGCTRPILFTFSEIICFYMILILAGINIYFKNNVSNIIFTIFFGFNFLFLCFTYFISREANDLVEEYTLSRLFGLSGSLAMPNLFFPLYYIGFNLGIIYYYHLNELSNKLIADKESKNFIPFKYCYNISSFISRINLSSIIKNIIMLICLVLIFFTSSIYTFIVRNLEEREILFTFEEYPISKFSYIYEGIIVGLIFSIFLLFYLCSDNNSLKNILSSEFFIFSHKISFVFFISFVSILHFFKIIGLIDNYLINSSMFTNSITLFFITCLFSIIITCLIAFPIKWLYFFIFNGFNTEDYKEILLYK